MKREGIWYFHKLVNGKREFNGRKTPFTLDTADLELAKTRRDAILKASSGAEVAKILGQQVGPAVATLGQVFEAYSLADHPREATRDRNMNCLRLVLRKARGFKNDQIAGLPVTVLTRDVVQDYQDATIREAKAAGAADSGEQMHQTKYSANRMLAMARSIFANEKCFRKLHVPLDPGFRDADDFNVRIDFSFTPMTQVEMDLFGAKSKELRASRPNVYATYLCMQWIGMRNEEVEFCRPAEWLVQTGDRYEMNIRTRDYFVPKGTPGKVPVPKWVAEQLLEIAGAGGWLDEEEEKSGHRWLIREPSKTGRYNVTHREINDWMREVYQAAIADQVLPEGTEIRTCYDFRKQAGSILYEQTHDIMAVQRFLRHESVTTTTKWYANLIKQLPAIVELKGR